MISVILLACDRAPSDATPEGAVREFVERMERLTSDPEQASLVFSRLSQHSQDNLTERARHYTAATGKPMRPEAMIAGGRFLLSFEPKSYSATVTDGRALVRVAGAEPALTAEVVCVREQGAWKVDVALPPITVRTLDPEPVRR